MIVTITSLRAEPRLEHAGHRADRAAADAGGDEAERHGERAPACPPGSASPTSAAAKPPAASWLSAPMLNSPARAAERERRAR